MPSFTTSFRLANSKQTGFPRVRNPGRKTAVTPYRLEEHCAGRSISLVNANSLDNTVDHTHWTRAVRVEAYAHAQVVTKELETENLKRSQENIRGFRGQRRNDLVKKLRGFTLAIVMRANADKVP